MNIFEYENIQILTKNFKEKIKKKTLHVDLNLAPKMNLAHLKSSSQRKEIQIYMLQVKSTHCPIRNVLSTYIQSKCVNYTSEMSLGSILLFIFSSHFYLSIQATFIYQAPSYFKSLKFPVFFPLSKSILQTLINHLSVSQGMI